MMKQQDWTLDLLTTWEAIDNPAFHAWWAELAERASNAHVFFHPVLVRVWLETYRPLRDIRPLFVRATHGEQQVLFPLVLWRRNWKNAWLREVVPAGYADYDYHDPLFLQPPLPDEVAAFYAALRAALDQSVNYDRLLLDGLHAPYLPHYTRVTRHDACLSWPLSGMKPVEGLILPEKKRLAQDILRRYRRLQELGEIRFRRFTPADIEPALASLTVMLAQHAKRWPNAYKAPRFHAHLLDQGLRAGLVDFFEISLNGREIAWHICFTYHGCISRYMPAVDSEFMPFAPGHLSLAFALANAAADGIAVVDHLRGGEDYKSAWGGEETLVYDVTLDRMTLSSRLRLGIHAALRRVKTALKGQSK